MILLQICLIAATVMAHLPNRCCYYYFMACTFSFINDISADDRAYFL